MNTMYELIYLATPNKYMFDFAQVSSKDDFFKKLDEHYGHISIVKERFFAIRNDLLCFVEVLVENEEMQKEEGDALYDELKIKLKTIYEIISK